MSIGLLPGAVRMARPRARRARPGPRVTVAGRARSALSGPRSASGEKLAFRGGYKNAFS